MPEALSGLWSVPPGADFPVSVAEGLIARYVGRPPEDLARVTLLTNAPRMRRRIAEAFAAEGVRLLPRIGLVTDPGDDPLLTDLPPAAPSLRRMLDLARLVRRLIAAEPDLAPEAAVYDLAESLGALIDEMDGEGVSIDALRELETGEMSAHWARSLRFLAIAAEYAAQSDTPGPEARRRAAVAELTRQWRAAPPPHPVIVAGSTGSRGTTADLMEAVARLPVGALILPGFDGDMPAAVWDELTEPLQTEDHPQFRYAALLARLGRTPADVRPWGAAAPDPARNRMISLALRPAPVTDRWAAEGPALGDLDAATARLTLLEAPNERLEAEAIALRLRRAAEDGTRAALVTPDRTLARRVTAALDRWGLVPDDSAGRPLGLSAPGRLLRQVADLLGTETTPARLIALLRHPLVNGPDRGPHLLHTEALELWCRRNAVTDVGADALARWAADDAAKQAWSTWLAGVLPVAEPAPRPLADLVSRTLTVADALCRGPSDGPSGLWDRAAGDAAQRAMETLAAEADAADPVGPQDWRRILDHALRGEVRETETPHPDLMIRGTLEARVQGADLVILGGLAEGTWPAAPSPDPWLNRPLRAAAGMLLPDRQVGLSAHDFQQAAAAPEVWLTRAVRGAEAETVASRWLLRLTNLLDGLPDTGGRTALTAMRARGAEWVTIADAMDRRLPPVRPEPRPAPVPPDGIRPKTLPVTNIQTLIRDPYAVYAKRLLRLYALDPLTPKADARLRGIVLHEVMQVFLADPVPPDPAGVAARLLDIARDRLLAQPHPVAARLWLARFARALPAIAAGEIARAEAGQVAAVEKSGEYLSHGNFRLTAKADRIDRLSDGRLAIWDYKSSAPTEKQVVRFDRQLPLEAMIAELVGFEGVPPAPVATIGHIPLSDAAPKGPFRLDETDERDFRIATIRAEFDALIAAMLAPDFGFGSRRMMETSSYDGDYDHLARFGEWQDSDTVTKVRL